MTLAKSTAGSTGAIPRTAPPRCACAAFAAAISAFDGTQPKLRQSPPMRSRSISTTSRPSCAAPEATTSPAEPPPTTQTSGVSVPLIPSVRLARLEVRIEDGDQRQDGEREQRDEEAPVEDGAEVGCAALVEQRAEARADAGIDAGAGNDADRGGEHVAIELHAEQRRHDVDQPERKDRHQPEEQEIAETVAAEAFLEPRQRGAGAPVEEVVKGGARGEEDRGGTQGRADDGEKRAQPSAEQEAAERRHEDRDRQGEGDDDRIGRHERQLG